MWEEGGPAHSAQNTTGTLRYNVCFCISVFVYLCICVFVCLYFVQNTTGVHALQTCNVFGGLTPSFNTVPVSALVVALHSECLPQNLNYS